MKKFLEERFKMGDREGDSRERKRRKLEV